MPVSSTVWWAPVSRSPSTFRSRSSRPWRASGVEQVVEEADAGGARRPSRRRRAPATGVMSVSLVVREMSARAGHARRSMDSAWTGKPSARARAAPDGARRAAAPSPQRYASHPAPERGRRQRRLEPRRAARGQDVVRAGDVVAERGGGVAADEHAARAADLAGQRLGLGAHQLEVLGRDLLGGPAARPARPRRAIGLHLAGARAPPRRAAPARWRSPPPGCPARARPARAGRGRSARGRRPRRPPPRARSGPAMPSMPTCPTTWRLASCTHALPGPAITSTACTDSVPYASAAIAWAPPIR